MSQQTDDGAVQHRLRGLRHLVGNAPILVIDCTYRGRPRRVFAKAEHLNMTGSIKDRMALHIVVMGRERGLLSDGAPLVEATSGNTGIAFAGVGRAMGHPVTIYMPDWMSRERVDLIRSLGAEIRLVTRDEGGFLGAIELAEKHAAERADVFLPRQFSNEDNVAAHRETTGPEIWWQLRYHGLTPDAFVAGVGTGGTIMGVGQALREMDPSIRIHPLEPASSPTLRTGHCTGSHRIQGVSDEFVPPIVDLEFLDEIVDVDDGDAILMAQRLARELGLGVGISSGANFLGVLKLLDEYGPDKTIVTVFPDDNKKYLSTDLLREEPLRAEYLTPDVTLERFSAFKRVCRTCCDPADCVMPEVFASQDGDLPPCPNWRGPGTTPFC